MCFRVFPSPDEQPQRAKTSNAPNKSIIVDSSSPYAKETTSISSRDSNKYYPYITISQFQRNNNDTAFQPFSPFVPLKVDERNDQKISGEEIISSFKQVKVYYCSNINRDKNGNDEQFNTFTHKGKSLYKGRTCTCTKTKCLKKYCECLANNQYCVNCNCVDCHNTSSFQSEKLTDDLEVVTCTCTKSNCNKKYCECYKAGRNCNGNCRCLNCANKFDGGKKCNDDDKKGNFIMERISVLIEKRKMKIEKKEIFIQENEEILNLLGKKREQGNVLNVNN